VNAGLGVTVRTPQGLPAPLLSLPDASGLPSLPRTTLSLFERKDMDGNSAAVRLGDVLIASIEGTLGGAI
jgi:hypothetical protein